MLVKDIFNKEESVFKNIFDAHCTAENISGCYIESFEDHLNNPYFKDAIAGSVNFGSWKRYIKSLRKKELKILMGRFEAEIRFSFCFSNPFFTILRDNKLWLSFEVFNLLQSVGSCTFDENEVNETAVDGVFSNALRRRVFLVEELNLLISLGPCWVDIVDDTSSVAENLDEALARLSNDLAFGGNFVLSVDRITRHSRHRGIINDNDLNDRAEIIRQSIKLTLNTKFTGKTSAPALYWLSVNHLMFLRSEMVRGSRSRVAKLLKLPSKKSVVVDAFSGNFQLIADDNSNIVSSAIKYILVKGKIRETEIVSKNDFDYLSIEELYGSYGSMYLNNVISNRNYYFLERILILRLWFQSIYTVSPVGIDSTQILDELSSRVRTIFSLDACNFYKYQPLEKSSLNRIGSSYDERFGKNCGKNSPTLMIRAASVPERRSRSVAYRVFDTGDNEFWPEIPSEKILLGENEPRWKSVLALPLQTRGQIWGAVEVKAEWSSQLFKDYEKWLEEIARIIMPTITDRWLIHHLNRMFNISIDEKIKPKQRYIRLAEEFGKIFSADSVVLYVKDGASKNHLIRRGYYGRKYPNHENNRVDLENVKTITARCFQNFGDWEKGVVGSGNFGERWLDDPNNQWLYKNNHRSIAVVPIMNSLGKPFASVTLTSKAREKFSLAMDDGLKLVSREMGALVEAVWRAEQESINSRQLDAHSVKTRIPRTLSALDRIMPAIKPIIDAGDISQGLKELRDILQIARASNHIDVDKVAPDADATIGLLSSLTATTKDVVTNKRVSVFNKALTDLRDSSQALRLAAIRIAGGEDLEDPNNADPEDWNGTWTEFRSEIVYAIKTINNRRVRGSINIPTPWEIPSGIYVGVPGIVVSEILSNLIDNAIKYDFSRRKSVEIKARFDEKNGTIGVVISNFAPKISEEFRRNIGSVKGGGARADYAKTKDKTGSGLGLFYAFQMAKKWGFTIKYHTSTQAGTRSRAKRRGAKLVKHEVLLHFPKKIVRGS